METIQETRTPEKTSIEGSQGVHHRLKARALGFPTVMAQSVALISPTMTAVLIIPICFADSGQGTWLAYAFGTLMLLFVVFCLNQFAKRSAMPGSMYGYTAKGLGPGAGVMSGWALIWCYTFIGVAGLTGGLLVGLFADPHVIIMDPLTGHWKFQHAHDGLHPTAAGDTWIARKVASILRPHGILASPLTVTSAVICDLSVRAKAV